MSNISMVEAKLPPGFRFHPRDDELVCDYLMKKITNSDSLLLIEVDLNKSEPWDIPETACVGGKEWYFYSQRDRKYATGLRTNRATATGYWKATGKDRSILRKGTLVGMRKTLVFYQGRAPKGRKTDWVMHEFRLEPSLPRNIISQQKEDWVLCRLFYKNREVASLKPNSNVNNSMGIISCYEDTGTSSSLPPLMDSYITFDQTQTNLLDDQYEEQVPCFSIFSQNNLIFPPMELQSSTTKTTGGFGQNLPMSSTSATNPNNLDSFCCEKKVFRAVLDQLNKMETVNNNNLNDDNNNNIHIHGGSPPSLREASCESFLSEVGISNIWNDY